MAALFPSPGRRGEIPFWRLATLAMDALFFSGDPRKADQSAGEVSPIDRLHLWPTRVGHKAGTGLKAWRVPGDPSWAVQALSRS